MTTTNIFAWLTACGLYSMTSPIAAGPPADDARRLLAEAEPRIRAIYERREFRAAEFSAAWRPDSSGYRVQERDPHTNQTVDVCYELRAGRPVRIAERMEPPTPREQSISPDGKWELKAQDGRLFLRELATGESSAVTPDAPERELSFGDLSWNSDSTYACFVESDATDVRRRAVLVPEDPSYPGVRHDRFARVGEKITSLRVGVVGVARRQVQWLPPASPPEGFYLGQVEWARNSTEILIESLSRFRDKREFLLVDIAGRVNTIYSETNDAWAVESQGKTSGLTWIRDGAAFIVVSEKDGWRHAYLHSRDGREQSRLTPGRYDIIDKAVVDESGGWYYFYASPENGTQRYLYRVPLDGSGTLERVTPPEQPGTHNYQFSPDARWAFHTYSTLNSPPTIELIEINGHRSVQVLEDNAAIRKRVQALGSNATEFIQLEIDGGVSLDAWIIKPKNFDAAKKYPVLVYVYGEPYAQTVLDNWGASQMDFHRVVADLGYVVVSIDNRGTPAPKGAAWRRSIFGSLGPLSTEDQAAALQELGRTRPYVDQSRVGIWGWSGGGSNTLNAMFRKPDLYQLGIAVVPKPQPHLYNAWFQEIYMRTREVNPDGYQQSAPLHFAAGLRGKLLIITGSGETNTHVQIIEGLVDRLIELGKPFDYMVYPNRDHGLREGPGTEVHVRMLILRYLLENLPLEPAADAAANKSASRP